MIKARVFCENRRFLWSLRNLTVLMKLFYICHGSKLLFWNNVGKSRNWGYGRYKYLKCQEEDANDFVEQLINNVEVENDVLKLLYIKEWLIYALHTMQLKEFSKVTPCISCSYGQLG